MEFIGYYESRKEIGGYELRSLINNNKNIVRACKVLIYEIRELLNNEEESGSYFKQQLDDCISKLDDCISRSQTKEDA